VTYHFQVGRVNVLVRDEKGFDFTVPRSSWEGFRANREAVGNRFYPAQLIEKELSEGGETHD
jgi:hypothetical protein